MKSYRNFYFFGFVDALVLSIAHQTMQTGIPDVTMQWLWLCVFAGYAPLLYEAVREGKIFVPPQIVLRQQRPVFFWLAALSHLVLMLAGVVVLLEILRA